MTHTDPQHDHMLLGDEAERHIEKVEQDYRHERRTMLGLDPAASTTGLALSGGGIRSATFSLGTLKAFSELGIIHKFDYLSTVSGGGYAGAFYGSLFTPLKCRDPSLHDEGGDDISGKANPLATARGDAAIRWLRNYGRYLLPNGSGDALRLVTITIRAWFAIQLVIGATLLAILLFLKTLQATMLKHEVLRSLDVWAAGVDLSPWLWPHQWLLGQPVGAFVLSGFWPVVAACAIVAAVIGWAYWLTRYGTVRRSSWRRFMGPSFIGTLLIACISFLFVVWVPDANLLKWGARIVGPLALGAILASAAGRLRTALRDDTWRSPEGAVPGEEEDRVRSTLTVWMKNCILAALVSAIFALVGTPATTFYITYLQEGASGGYGRPLTLVTTFAVLVPAARWLMAKLQTAGMWSDILRKFGRLIALAAGLLLAFAICLFWAIVAEYLTWRGGPVGGFQAFDGAQPLPGWTLASLWAVWAVFAVMAVSIGFSFGFLNLSAFAGFYAARLRRSYLGASNPNRMKPPQTEGPRAERTRERRSPDIEDDADDITLQDYYRPGLCGPIHLINVTVNETQGKKGSSLVLRDRKGRPLTLSPAGHIVPGTGAKRDLIPFRNARGEGRGTDDRLPLSAWMGISGAALSTGLGQNTSLGLSLLAGLANLRLGVWWDPIAATRGRALSPMQWTQRYLFREFLSHFSIQRKERWYLTDGGHFENTGVYELVRRRVELIVACDCGADPDYTFADVVNLIRKLRIDFDADLDFLPSAKLDALLGADAPNRRIFGEISELVQYSRTKVSRGPYAAIGRIRMRPDGNKPEYATLILLKPRLCGLEMADLLDYYRINPKFPQQTTGDQFFDEAQWESYYRLGLTIAELVFADPQIAAGRTGYWSPNRLTPIPWRVFPWGTDPWLAEATPDDSCKQDPCAAAIAALAAAPASGGSVAAVRNAGSGKLIAALLAGVGTVGLASGAGSELTKSLFATRAAASAEAVGGGGPAGPEGPGGRNGRDGGDAGTPDRITIEVDARDLLADINARLDTLIAQTRPRKPQDTGTPCLCDDLTELRVQLTNYFASQDRRWLPLIVRRMSAIETAVNGQGSQVRNEVKLLGPDLRQIHADLLLMDQRLRKVPIRIDAASPRENIRNVP